MVKMPVPTDLQYFPGFFLWHCLIFSQVAWKSIQVEQFSIISSSWHSNWSNISNCIPAAFSIPCGSGIADLVPCLVLLQVLFFCLPLQCHLWLQSHLRMSGMAAGLSVPQLWLMNSHIARFSTACLCACHLVLLFLFFFCCRAVWYVCAWRYYLDGNAHAISVLWLCLDSQSMMNSCRSGFYRILMLHWCFLSSIPWSLCDRLVELRIYFCYCSCP